jgi:hypothetical protein
MSPSTCWAPTGTPVRGREPLNPLSDDASFINGATVPIDGRRTVLGRDPGERDPGRTPDGSNRGRGRARA